MTVDYPGAIDRIINDERWVFTNALKKVPNEDITIVNHKTAMNRIVDANGVADFFANDPQHLSSHFVVGLKGEVVQLVQLSDGAGANCCLETGYSGYWTRLKKKYGNLNLCTISIEHVDCTLNNTQVMPEAQVLASRKLNLWLYKRYKLGITQIKSHMSMCPISRKFCPGSTFDFQGMFDYIRMETAPTDPWYMYKTIVPFGDVNYDSALGGAHDMDVNVPPNYPITAILTGWVSSITSPLWGKQVGVKLEKSINGVGYCAYLHLSAVNAFLNVGDYVHKGELIGWAGGGNTPEMYMNTTNPTNENFLNDGFNSTQIQAGFALMYGNEYGVNGWTKFPPVDWKLDPTPIIDAVRKEYTLSIEPDTFNQYVVTLWRLLIDDLPMGTEMFKAWRVKLQQNIYMGSPIGRGKVSVDKHNVKTAYMPTNCGTLMLQEGKEIVLLNHESSAYTLR